MKTEVRFPPDLVSGFTSRRHCLLVARAWATSGGTKTDRERLDAALAEIPTMLLEQTGPACTLGGALLTLQDMGLLSDVRPAGAGWWTGSVAT